MTNFLEAEWKNIIMANYAVPVSALKPYLPKGVEIDTYNNIAYVSLVGFMFNNSRIFKLPIPALGTFEEVNLRFYVSRKEGNITKRGVVFINETVPYKAVAWLANKLYKEHYTAVKTKHNWQINNATKQITYQWLVNKQWNTIAVEAHNEALQMSKNSMEEFIFEHYYGYTKVNETTTQEYKISHPRWAINTVTSAIIQCDFEANYGVDFAFLNNVTPTSVFIAEGSAIAVQWKRKRI